MARLPDYIGPAAFGLKMGVIVPGVDLAQMVLDVIEQCANDQLLTDGDVLCITESVVARWQHNYVTIDDIGTEIRWRLNLTPRSCIGVVFPIASRNRFSLILKGIAAAVPEGEVIVQLSWPADEVGNALMTEETAKSFQNREDVIWPDELGVDCVHPITKVNYVDLYRQTIESMGTRARIYFGNEAAQILRFSPDGVIAADIHSRERTRAQIGSSFANVITLVDVCSDRTKPAWSEWGLLGSNLSSGNKLKLAPREASRFAVAIQERVRQQLGTRVEVLVYGDGAYKDPSTGIYELADPEPVFGATAGFQGVFRQGVKYKYLADLLYEQGESAGQIEQSVADVRERVFAPNETETEGTTPRRMQDVIASLADLVSGSADAGTPVVLVKGFLK